MTEIRTAQLSQGELRYFTFGRGEKNLLVIPGLSVRSIMPSAEAIAKAYEIFTPDYRVWFAEHRTKVPPDFTVAMMARDLGEFLTGLGLRSVDVLGVSMGGMAAQCLALDHPELINRLVLGSTASQISPSAAEVIRRWVRLAEKRDAPGLCRSFADLVYSPGFRQGVEPMVQSMARSLTEEELEQFANTARGLLGFRVSHLLSRISCPVFVIGAKKDLVLTGEASEELARQTNGRLYLYENYGHAVYDEAPDYRSRVLDYLRSQI